MPFDTPNQGDQVLESDDVDHQQTTNRTHSGDSISPSSVSTDELYNDEEPNLDISEAYSWVLSAGRPLPTWHFNTTTGVQQNTSGSGAISANTARGDISSGSTDGSHARALRTIANDNNYSFNNGQRAFMQVRVDDTQGKLFAGTGIVNEDDFTPEHIGFKWTGGNLEGSVADGSTESTTTLDASPTTGSFVDLYIDYDGTEAKFWIEKTPAGNDPDGTITTNLPSGDAGNIYCFHVENDSATNRQMFATIAAGGQMP